jgi:hypothetical protein
MPQTWQIGAGESGRFYSDLFFAHDVMFMGPGRFGAYSRDTYQGLDYHNRSILNSLRRFYEEVQPGDRVVVRQGHRVVGLGIVHEEGYGWQPAFDDVHGWDLQHAQRVIWQPQLSEDLVEMQREQALFSHMKQIPTFTRLNHQPTLETLAPLFEAVMQREPCSLPDPLPPALSLEEFGQALFARGLANDAVDKVLDSIRRQRRLLAWYDGHGDASDRPTEHEIVAHMVLPLMLALGWSEQLLGIEWKRIDLAAFWATPTTPKHCVLVCEAKSPRHGLQNDLDQARRYVNDLDLVQCGKIVLTQGDRLYLYERPVGGQFAQTATGYINFRSLRIRHLVPARTSAVDTLMALTPAGITRPIASQPSSLHS